VGNIKSTICRYFAISIIFCAVKVGAQTQTVSTSALVNLKVRSTSALTVNRDLSMGIVIQGTTSLSVDPVNGGNSAAYFSLSGPPNTSVTVTFSSTSLTDGVRSIPFAGILAGSKGTVQSQATLLSNGSAATTSPTGEYYFWAGGAATLSPTQPIGFYAGSFVLTIAY
jgi:hypothetical protein